VGGELITGLVLVGRSNTRKLACSLSPSLSLSLPFENTPKSQLSTSQE
jgi:hypothetical protein